MERESRAFFPVARIAQQREEVVFDCETYVNYWLLAFKRLSDGKVKTFELYEGQRLDRDGIALMFRTFRCYSFNGIYYDMPVIAAALHNCSTQVLKRISDEIIIGQAKPWELEDRHGFVIPRDLDHIDLIEPAFGDGSLKLYGGRMHSKRLQDLPIEPEATIEPSDRAVLRDYCVNDLDTTIDLRNALAPDLELRATMSLEYGIDLRSKSDAQMAEAIFRKKLEQRAGQRIYPPEIAPGTTFTYSPPEFVRFSSPACQGALQRVLEAQFMIKANGQPWVPAWGEESEGGVKGAPIVAVGQGLYRMGYGGLHSSEECRSYYTNETHVIEDDDVASYYPEIARKCRYFPRHLGPAYLEEYSNQIELRLAAKAAGRKGEAQTRKILVNGGFGKHGSRWSILYAPDMMIHITVTGQLALLMLIEAFERHGIQVISANTDGVITYCRRDQLALKRSILDVWAKVTQFTTETNRYKAIFSRDVNNYLALKFAGKEGAWDETKTKGFKGKGAFNDGAEAALAKNPSNVICIDAVRAFLEHGTPLNHTIYSCRDIRKFLTVRRVTGGALYRDGYLGKVVRWYVGQGSQDVIRYKTLRGKQTIGNTVARTEGCVPLMVLPDEFPRDVDMQFYVKEAISILQQIGYQ